MTRKQRRLASREDRHIERHFKRERFDKERRSVKNELHSKAR